MLSDAELKAQIGMHGNGLEVVLHEILIRNQDQAQQIGHLKRRITELEYQVIAIPRAG